MPRRIRSLILAGLCSLAAGQNAITPTHGLNFSPYLDGQGPGSPLTAAQIRSRLEIIAPYTKWIRTFASTEGLEMVPAIAKELGLKVAANAFISGDTARNAREIAKLIANANAGVVDLCVVGSEAVLRGDVTPQQLVEYMSQVRASVPAHIPVTTAEVWNKLVEHPELVVASDLVFANIYPYWEETSAANAVCAVAQRYAGLKQLTGLKPVLISEAGWPSAGPSRGAAVPSPANASLFALQFLSWAAANSVPSFYFAAFDEKWKAAPPEGEVGAHWGIWDSAGVMKPGMDAFFGGQRATVDCNGAIPGPTAIQFIYVPPYGSSDNLEVQVTGVKPSAYVLAPYIRAGNWWTKPTFANPTVPLNPDGTASVTIVSHPNDRFATEIAVFLIPAGSVPPVANNSPLPQPPGDAVASLHISRTQSSISGTITDTLNHPIRGATVADARLGTTTSAPNGKYSFFSIAVTGTASVSVARSGYTFPQSPAAVNIVAGNLTLDFTGIPVAPVLSITKSHAGNFTRGQAGATYTVVVSNAAGAGATNGTAVTVTETVPAGLTLVSMGGTGWSCGGGTCSRGDVLNGGASYPPITVTVNVAQNASSPQVNTVGVSGGGSAGATATDPTIVTGGGLPIRVNAGGGAYTEPGSGIEWSADARFSGGYIYSTAQPVANTSTPGLYQSERWAVGTLQYQFNDIPAGNYTVKLKFAEIYYTAAGSRVFRVLLNGQTVETALDIVARAGGAFRAYDAVYPVAVSGGQITLQLIGVVENPKINAIEITSGGPNPPSLSIIKSHTGNFTQGQTGATYTVVVSNAAGAGPTSGPVTVTENVPSGLTLKSMSGTGWSCGGNTCGRSDVLNGGSSYPAITATVDVAANASSPQVNTVRVSGGGSPDATASDPTIVNPTIPPSLSIAKTHSGNFTRGQTGVYTVVVSNAAGAGPTSGTVTVTETLPSGLTPGSMSGTGWTCAENTCTRNSVLNGGASYPAITVTVNVAANASSPLVNRVDVSGGGSAGATATDPTVIVEGGSGGFPPIRVNAGGGAYTEPGTATPWSADTGFIGGYVYSTAQPIANTSTPSLYQTERWTVGTLQYQFNSIQPGSYSVKLKFAEIYFTAAGSRVFRIIINGQTVETAMDVVARAGGAFRALDVVYPVAVSGGQISVQLVGVVENPKINAIEITRDGAPVPSLSITKTHTGNFTRGQSGTYTVVVSNAAGASPTSGPVSVKDGVPGGLTLVSMSGSGWLCGGDTCGRSDVLAGGASYPPITVTVNVATNASSPQVNAVSVSGGGSAGASATDSTVIAGAFEAIRVNAGGGAYTEPGTGIGWSADTGFTGGNAYLTGQPIANTSTPSLYQSERWTSGTLQYQFNNIPAGNYSVKLKFAEIYFTTTGSRVFRIVINGQTVETAMDVVARAGGAFRALDVSYPVAVSGGQITVQMTGIVENPKVNAIEVTAQ